MLNCNKRSITVNMKSAEGKQVFVDLLKKCDIMMENFGPGVLERLGFTWEKIHEINPKHRDGLDQGLRLVRARTPTSRPTRTSRRRWAAR